MSPSLPPLCTDTIWAILNDQLADAVVNQLVWYQLGYRYDAEGDHWGSDGVAPAWAENYPDPPDFIASRPATIKLSRSLPPQYKQLLKEKLGFKGYTVDQLVPRLTRRATMANWLLAQLQSEGSQ
ncbi:MAG: DUF1823 family protein [Nodosilinea sp.]